MNGNKMKKTTNRKRTPVDDPSPLSEEHQRHQELFKERRRWAGFCRWMASRYRGVYPTTPGKPHKATG
jgi:hypothetical protein